MSKKIEIEIPDGKEAQWVNDVLTLVDAKNYIIEDIKSFDDAVKELTTMKEKFGDVLAEYYLSEYEHNKQDCSPSLLAFLKLRIITYVLNQGWTPQYVKGEEHYVVNYEMLTMDEYKKLGDDPNSHILIKHNITDYKVLKMHTIEDQHTILQSYGSGALIFKSKELAEYAAGQFISIYAEHLGF